MKRDSSPVPAYPEERSCGRGTEPHAPHPWPNRNNQPRDCPGWPLSDYPSKTIETEEVPA